MSALVKAAKYFVVGGLAFVVDYGVTWLLLPALPLLLANTFGFITANVANFLLAHSWVFDSSWSPERLFKAYLSVLGISLIGLALNNAVVWFLVGMAALPLLISKAIATLVVMSWNFLARLFWVYRDRVG
jgi:putative flippase GtrA